MGETRILEDFSFDRAMDAVLDGDIITRKEWEDKRHYGILQDHILCIHKAGEKKDKLHPWILTDGDIMADDWIIIQKK